MEPNDDAELDDLLLQRLEGLRQNLLDLSNRNRLLSFKHSDRARTHVRIIDELPDILFQRLRDGRRLQFKSLPEPEAEPPEERSDLFLMELEAARATHEGYANAMAALEDDELNSRKAAEIERALRDDVRQTLGLPPWTDERLMSREEFARQNDLLPGYELPWQTEETEAEHAQRHTDSDIQTLLFPAEMDRKLSGIVDQARTMLQEAGVNTLYVAFGFLEYYEAGSAEAKHLAPLLLLPAQIDRRMANPWRRYSLTSDGADVEVNETLAIRLRNDFGYQLPTFADDETPEAYLRKIDRHISSQPRWRVRRFVTVGHFGFSKLPMYNDLSTVLWRETRRLERHKLVRQILLGAEDADEAAFVAEDYEIDSPEIDAKNLTLIADADASQHSALVDVIDGKDLVIQGPPGTGKSQTITNIIAALMARGKSVLFVAEKLAALNVVHARLKHAHLADFCLQVHSNKVPKSSVLNALKTRIEIQNTREEPKNFATQVEELKTCRDKLNGYAAQMNSQVGKLGLTVQQVLWAERRARMEADEGVEAVGDLLLDGVADLTPLARSQGNDAVREMFVRLAAMKSDEGSLQAHPWSWVEWCDSGPFAEDEFRTRTAQWLATLEALGEARDALITEYGCRRVAEFEILFEIARCLAGLPDARPQPFPALAKAIWEDGLANTVEKLLDCIGQSDGEELPHVFEPHGRVPTDKSWKRVAEAVDAALGLLAQEAQGVEDLAEAQLFGAELREVASLVERGVRLAHSMQRTAGEPVSSSYSALTIALKALRLAHALPQESLVVRNVELLGADAELALTEGVETAKSLRESRDLLEKIFVLRPLPDIYDVNIHARALRRAGSFSWFDGEVKQAKEFFHSIANTQKRVSTADMASLFGKLESYLDARRTFEGNPHLNALCGNWFKGEETEFARFLDLVSWQRDVSREFPQGEPSLAAYRKILLGGSYDVLSEARSAAESLNIDNAIEEVGSLAQEVESVEEEIAAAFHKVDGIERACAELADNGVAAHVKFAGLPDILSHLKSLDDVRIAARSADAVSQNAGIAIEDLRDVLGYLRQLEAMNIPRELKSRLAERCRDAELRRMREHGDDIGRLLEEASLSHAALYGGGEGAAEEEIAPRPLNGNLDALISRLDLALKMPGELAEWIDYIHARKRTGEYGLSEFVARLEAREVSPECAAVTHDWMIYRSLAKLAYDTSAGLSETSGVSISQLRKKFQSLDREVLELKQRKLAADLCRQSIAQGNGVGKKSSYSELSLIRHEISKKRRHVPLRDLFGRSTRALQQMKPCFMMSPLSVATFLQPGQAEFDVVVIDEASQMPLEDALGAIARAKQCVIVGDNMQLPPTSFFRRFEDVIDEDGDVEDEDLDVESVLDQGMNVFRPPRALRWHYRSQHQNLIAFSNKHFYDSRLTVFPSFRLEDKNFGVRLVKVDGQYADRRNLVEVEEITDWARQQMKAQPERTLGIVAVNQLQRDLIRDEMDRLFQRDPEAEAYRKKWENTLHPFFVKNLENVQGDERDIIAISTVYGPNADGRVMQNFGPISKKHGHRRLNVLFTRARQQVVLFSSLTPDEIQIRETTGHGPRALRGYLEFAHTSRLDPGWLSDREPDSDFEVAVAGRIAKHGYEAVPQVGVSGYFIDLGIRHPDFPDHFLLGVECDGATYHSAKSARDRDRLREEVLKGQGWILYRIWSTDWFRDPNGETRKLVEFIEMQAEQRRERLKTLGEDEEPIAPSSIADDAEVTVITPKDVPGDDPDPEVAAGNEPEELEDKDGEPPEPSEPAKPLCAVGDTVVFHYEDAPEEVVSATIVIGESDVEQGAISRLSPVGDALVGASAGDDVEVYLADGTRTIIVDEVRKEQAALSG